MRSPCASFALLAALFVSSAAAAEAVRDDDALERVARWVAAERAAPGVAAAPDGALLARRQAALIELARRDPGRAVALAVPADLRGRLPAPAAILLERRISARGTLKTAISTTEGGAPTLTQVIEVGGRTYRAHARGERARPGAPREIAVNAVVIGDEAAIDDQPARVLSPEEVAADPAARAAAIGGVCPISGKPGTVVAEMGGQYQCLCETGHVAALNAAAIAAEAGAGADGGQVSSSWTLGAKTALFVRIDFSDATGDPVSNASAATLGSQVDAFFRKASHGATSVATTTTPTLRAPHTMSYYSGSDAFALASDIAPQVAAYSPGSYQFVVYLFRNISAWGWAGMGYVGPNAQGAWINGYLANDRVFDHEMGHNYGLMHSNSWATTDGTAIGAGANAEYGDVFDTMGGGDRMTYSPSQQWRLNWLPNTGIASVSASGTYRLYAHDAAATLTSGRLYALKLRKDGARNYWVSYRDPATDGGVHGAFVHWGVWTLTGVGNSNGGSSLLDMTPGTAGNFNDSALAIGSTFTDSAAGISIAPTGSGGTGADAYLDVSVTVPATSDTTAPTVAITAPANGATVSGATTIAATASDGVGVTRVDFLVDGAVVASDTSSPYATSWTPASTPGPHALQAKAYDAAGNVGTSATVTVTVPDSTAPTVAITSPANGATVTGMTTISATASDDVGVMRVDFLVDGVVIANDNAMPYQASWPPATAGSHTVQAKARDAAGNVGASAVLTVTVPSGAGGTTGGTTTGTTTGGTTGTTSSASSHGGGHHGGCGAGGGGGLAIAALALGLHARRGAGRARVRDR